MFSTQFDKALENIEPTQDDKDHAPEAHDQVKTVLAADDVISGWGFSPILIGSYKRRVSIRRMKDVDVFGRLLTVGADELPATLLKEFERVLKAAFPAVNGKPRVARQARSLQVAFPEYDGLYVDAVPARPYTTPYGEKVWQLPMRNEQDWQVTNPEELGRLTTELNDADHHNGMYVPTVKLMRQTRRSLMGKKKPGGLVVEIATLHAFRTGRVGGATQAEYFVSALRETATVLTSAFVLGLGLDDPTLQGEKVYVRGDDADKQALANAFREAADKAETALHNSDRCAAAKAFRDILGKAVDDLGNNDYVFPMPSECNLDGTVKRFAAVTAGDRQVPAGNRRFG
ncbi:MAG TPA: hypothetical protein VHB69_07340 [Mycobacteriales bacterium]|nr:hypothetical protein [Mycobacteriales bacterium]